MNKNLEILQGLILENFLIPAERVIPEAKLEEDLGIDSLGLVKLILDLEEACKISISDDECSGIKTVDDLIVIMNRKTS